VNSKRRVSVQWLGGYRTQIDVRGVHQMQGDETPEYGGEDSGPMPTELLLAAVGSCMCLAVAHVARKRRIEIGQLSLEVGAEKDMQAFRFSDIYVTIRADLPQDQLDPLVEQARRYCFVSNTLTNGCDMHYTAESIAVTPE
jgi:putative redox protein